MGVAVATIPLAGCDPQTGGGENTSGAPVLTAPAEEIALYERARAAGTVAAAEAFLRSFPNSVLVRNLLRSVPTTTLSRLDARTVRSLDPALVNSLPLNVQRALSRDERSGGEQNGSDPSDGYSG